VGHGSCLVSLFLWGAFFFGAPSCPCLHIDSCCSDVVGNDNRVNLSVYDRGSEREDFLGNVNFEPNFVENDPEPIKGWFKLQGRNNQEAALSGEIHVEISFQRTDKKHYGPEDFDILKLIGKGTFGQVYQVRKKDTKRIYAMKVLQKKVIVQKKEVAHTVGERNILVRTAMAESPFIVGLKFSFQTPSDLYLVTDYMSGGELFWHLQKEGRFNEQRAKFYIAELILALQHLHMHDIVYRDLKPENILLDANGHIALCDFGLSKANLTKNDTTNTFCGTTEYLAPEVLLDEAGYTKMVDFWSLGVLVFEMCCGWSPFYAEDTQQMYKNIAFGKVRFPRDTLTTEGRNFVKGLLNRNPKHRLGATDDAEELKRHPFFNDIDWEALTKKQIAPPFKPKLKSETDTSNFDPEFTNALNGASSLNARAAALAAGISSSTPLSPGMQANFKGFTFVDENLMEENLRHRVQDDYEDMDQDQRDEQQWETPVTTGNRDDRMSGVERTGANQDTGMFNNEGFDL
jgi:serine/threonine protein kinase